MIPQTARRAFLIAIIVTLGGFVFGLDAAVISGTVPFITSKFDLSEMQVGTAVSAPGMGVLFALLLAGYVCDKFGRKKALVLVAGLYLISAVWSAFATSYVTLVIARFIGGLAFTSLSLASMYLGEIAPPKWRGKLVAMNQTSIVLGFAAAYFINYYILLASKSDAAWVANWGFSTQAWRWMLGSEIPFAMVWFVGLFFVPESPRWLFRNKRMEEARSVMAQVLSPDEIAHEIKEVEESLSKGTTSLSVFAQFAQLFTPRLRLVLLLGIAIAAVQPATGINAVLFYAPTVFEQLGGGTDAAFRQSAVVGIVSVIFTFFAILLIDKLGRRPMMIGGLIWCIVSLGICSYGFKTARYQLTEQAVASLPDHVNKAALKPMVGVTYLSDTEFKNALKGAVGELQVRDHSSVLLQKAAKINATLILLGIMSFISAFQFSVGPIMWVLFSEIFPTAVRGVAIPSFAFVTSIVSYFITQFFPWQLSTLGAANTFLSYALMSFVGLIAIYRWLPETKNKTIEEVEMDFEAAYARRGK
ncbi:MAG: MFS transporter [Lacunisphaera sp.]|nr:MFS transporter [Lacunisphaera sp.]